MRSEYEDKEREVEVCETCADKMIDYIKENKFTNSDMKTLLGKSKKEILQHKKIRFIASVMCKFYRENTYEKIPEKLYNMYSEDKKLSEYF
jgi:protein-arginine kinase activator protein McsA